MLKLVLKLNIKKPTNFYCHCGTNKALLLVWIYNTTTVLKALKKVGVGKYFTIAAGKTIPIPKLY